MNVLDLFSGIGGFSLGLERAGMRTVAFCEIDPFCRRVLAKHWPRATIYEDVRELTASRLESDGIRPDVICGGFPCQDISVAGKGAGIEGERSGLWKEFYRLIGELRPRYVIVENTAALLGRGLSTVLGDLAEIGYDAEWHCIPASAVGAEHIRDRTWIVANPNSMRELQPQGCKQDERRRNHSGAAKATASDPVPQGLSWRGDPGEDGQDAPVLEPWLRSSIRAAPVFPRDHWKHQPLLGRGVHGIRNRMDRIGALGNAIVPQIPEIIGRAIMKAAQK